MYNQRIGRAIVVIAGCAVLVVGACSSFGEEEVPTSGSPDSGLPASDAAPDGASVDGSPSTVDDSGADAYADAGGDGGEIFDGETAPSAPVSCGPSTCAIGEGCCVGAAGPMCMTRAACTGFFLACVADATCGSASICCFDGTRSACARSCRTDGKLCKTGSDCTMGACGPVKCAPDAGAPITPFSMCANTTVLPVTRDGTTCTR